MHAFFILLTYSTIIVDCADLVREVDMFLEQGAEATFVGMEGTASVVETAGRVTSTSSYNLTLVGWLLIGLACLLFWPTAILTGLHLSGTFNTEAAILAALWLGIVCSLCVAFTCIYIGGSRFQIPV
jgi:hypothetical protein